MNPAKTYEELLAENKELRWQLEEATDTIDAIRTGQVDALVVQGSDGHELYSLKTADQTYRVFIEKMNEGALTLNEQGTIIYCNSTFAAMVDEPLSKVLGISFSHFIPDGCRADYELLFAKGWKNDVRMELPVKCREREVPCQLSVTTLELDEGQALSIIVTDLSFLKETQALLKANNDQLIAAVEALEASNNDLLQFASVASHDLQEPLRKILIFTDLLKSRLNGSAKEDVGHYLEKIVASSYRMKTMVTDILNYSKLANDGRRYEPTDLNVIVQEILEDYEMLIAEKGAKINVDKLPVIDAQRGQIRQAFQNLISNALKFTTPGIEPRIEIKVEEADNDVCVISISDNGIGFDPKYTERIFSLFQRLNTKDKYEGSGIGLAVTKKIVDHHNGSITAGSTEGAGAIFRLALPLKQAHS